MNRVYSFLFILLNLFSGCGKQVEVDKKNHEKDDALKSECLYKNIKDFYSFLGTRNNSVIKFQEKFLYDTCYLLIETAVPENIAQLFFHKNNQIVTYNKPNENFENFIYSSQEIYNWDELTGGNIKGFFALLMLQYHHYLGHFPLTKDKFINFICTLHRLTYKINEDTIKFTFWYAEYSKKLKYTIRITYFRKSHQFQFDHVNTIQIKDTGVEL